MLNIENYVLTLQSNSNNIIITLMENPNTIQFNPTDVPEELDGIRAVPTIDPSKTDECAMKTDDEETKTSMKSRKIMSAAPNLMSCCVLRDSKDETAR